MDTGRTAEWIERRTGIVELRYASPDDIVTMNNTSASNTSAASIPLAVARLCELGTVLSGSLALFLTPLNSFHSRQNQPMQNQLIPQYQSPI